MTVAEFLGYFPCYQSRSETEIGFCISLATDYCPLSQWGDRRVKGIILLTAHFLEVSWRESAVTASLASGLTGGNSISMPSAFDESIKLTDFGRQWNMLRNTIPVAPIIF
jgi:hypothetical protein